jgi:AraC family transcriptional regulator
MDYKIIDQPEFRIIGKSLRVSMKNGENFTKIPAFWQSAMSDGTYDTLLSVVDRTTALDDIMLGVCKDFADDMSEFTYMIAVPVTDAKTPNGYESQEIPALTWASFTSLGALPDALQKTWNQIMTEFIPSGEYTIAQGPNLEVYPNGNVMASDYKCHVWIPVVKK